MKIQVISYEKKIKYRTEHEYTYSPLNAPISLDAFDINIISLQTPNLWIYDNSTRDGINSISDLTSLSVLINDVKKSKIIVCFPQNYSYLYHWGINDYLKKSALKDMIPQLKKILAILIPETHFYDFMYENSTTICGDTEFTSAFSFINTIDTNQEITKCNGSEHVTALSVDSNIILTTLDVSKENTNINDFFKALRLIQNIQAFPSWLHEFKFLDDKKQENIVIEANNEIDKQNEKIKVAQEKLQKNLYYKSILFETGDTLVKVVFEILERILNVDLSKFVDKKEEDFKVSFEDITFIGEIKGIASNVKSENVSQLDVHCQIYNDSLDEDGKSENVKGLLIINPLRNKSPKERDEVHEKQIQLATKYGILIITTETLLLLFMAYLEGHITTDKIIELLKNRIGLLTHADFV